MMTISVFMIVMVASMNVFDSNYFTYEDCDYSCVETNLSCTISETTTDFLKMCIDNDALCEQRASSETVCLRKGLPPIGGEKIWPDYKHKYYPATATVAPDGPNTKDCSKYVLMLDIQIPLLILILIVIAVLLYKSYNNHDVTLSTDTEPLNDNIEEHP